MRVRLQISVYSLVQTGRGGTVGTSYALGKGCGYRAGVSMPTSPLLQIVDQG